MKEKEIHATGVSTNTQRGQAIVLIALGFVMLLAFTGLVVEVAKRNSIVCFAEISGDDLSTRTSSWRGVLECTR